MALDEANKKLFVGCRLPARLVILGTTSGRIVTSLSIVGDTDDIFYDPRTAPGLRHQRGRCSESSPDNMIQISKSQSENHNGARLHRLSWRKRQRRASIASILAAQGSENMTLVTRGY